MKRITWIENHKSRRLAWGPQLCGFVALYVLMTLFLATQASAQVWLPFEERDLGIPFEEGYQRFAEPEPAGMTISRNRLLVALKGENAILVLRLEDMKTITRWPFPNKPTDIIASDDAVFVIAEGRSDLVVLNRRSGMPMAQYPIQEPAQKFVRAGNGDFAGLLLGAADHYQAIDLSKSDLEPHHALPVNTNSLVVNAGGVRLFAGRPGAISILNREGDETETVLACSSLSALAVNKAGVLAAFCREDASFQFFAGMGGEVGPQTILLEELSGFKSSAPTLLFDEAGHYLFVAEQSVPDVFAFDLQTGTLVHKIAAGRGKKYMLSHEGVLYITNAETGRLVSQPIPTSFGN